MTVDLVASLLGDAETLDLLEALTYADGRAAGSVASSTWRMRLVADLCRRVRAELGGGGLRWQEPARLDLQPLRETRVVVAVPDRIGALATVAGVLALERLRVRSASMDAEPVRGLGLSQWLVGGEPPDPVRLRERLAVALRDDAAVVRRLAARDAGTSESHPPARVDLLPDVSDTATVLQVRAHDRSGLVYDVCAALASARADIRSAHVSTLGGECVDVFYLTDGGDAPLEDEHAATVAKAVLDRLT